MNIIDIMIMANRFANLGFDHHHTEKPEQERVRMEVFTNRIGNTSTHIYPHLDNELSHILYISSHSTDVNKLMF